MNKTNKKTLILVCAVLVVLIAAFAIVYTQWLAKPAQGQKELVITTTYADGSTKQINLSTDAEYLRGALEQEGLIEGEESEFGLYVKTVGGQTANEDNQEWWCFTKGGEMVVTGVDVTPIEDGDRFEITLTVGW